MASKGKGFRSLSVTGFEILVGKGDAENDALTFDVAEPHDFWLHVAGVSGSHVIVRNPQHLRSLPREVRDVAAALAAYHSKARSARGKVAVHLCQARDVRKPGGAPAGQVQLKRYETLRIYPRDVSSG